MVIIIKIKNKNTEVVLKNKSKIIDRIIIEGNYNLSRSLLPEIDNILKKNSLKIGDLKKIELESEINKQLTSVRIAKIVVKAINSFKNVN